MDSGTTVDLRGVWGSSGSNVFAVGGVSDKLNFYGTILHYNGNAWSVMITGTIPPLYAVWGTSRNDVFAVGANGTILHYNGFRWTAMINPLRGTTNYLLGVWGSGRKDVFAVGGSAILHYNGCTWTSMTNGETPYLINVWGSSETDVYAVGQYGTLLFYNGNKWSSIQSGTANDLFDIWGTSGREIFAVGDNGNIRHYSANDMDNDGVSDEFDECPESSLETTIIIGECDTEVQNKLFQNGCTLNDLVAECNANTDTRFGFVRCVNQHIRQLKPHKIGLREKWAILKCAFKAK
jgi:hypothetical protein